MDTLVAFLIAALVTFFFVRRYLRQLTAGQRAANDGAAQGVAAAAASVGTQPCPRCAKAISRGSAFCNHCGAALAMWTVHRADIRAASAGAPKGKPKPVINASLCIGCSSCVDICPETGTLEMLNGKAILAHAERCTGHAKCVEVCPTQAIALSFGGVLQTLRVPLVKEDFETNVPGLFIVGELAGMALIKSAVNEGKMVIDHLKRRMERDHPAAAQKAAAAVLNERCHEPAAPASQPTDATTDVLIVGSGPAGLSAALTAHQYGLQYVVLEQGEIAASIRQYPRHKFLMAEPLEIPLYGHLYVGDGTKETLLSVWEKIIQNTGVRIQTNHRVERVVRNGQGFWVETAKEKFHATYVVLAMGRRGTPRRLGVPGEELGKVTYKLIEADSYNDSDLMVVGGGDAAIEAALALGRGGRNRVTLSYRGDSFSRLRDRNRQQFELAEKEGRVVVLRSSQVAEVRPGSVLLDHAGSRKEIPNQFLFILIGGESPEEFLRKTGVEIVEKELAAATAW
jgi:thioredoxin reductase (NADPH)